MKARPRRVENRVAEILSDYLLTIAPVSKVERIPVLGRTGPDMDILPIFKIAVDVKSRKAIPKSYKIQGGAVGNWFREGQPQLEQVGVRLENLDLLFDIENKPLHLGWTLSKTVVGWLRHMDIWCDNNKPIVPALVLHWPGTPVGHSTFVIFKGDRRTLHDRRKCFNDL